jgi:hypothetical protein
MKPSRRERKKEPVLYGRIDLDQDTGHMIVLVKIISIYHFVY